MLFTCSLLFLLQPLQFVYLHSSLYKQISYTASAISLSDKRQFPTFVRTISSDNASIDIVTALVKEYGWEQVAIITEINALFMNVSLQCVLFQEE